jgi:hypothetical protein
MQMTITTPALLFPAISLLLLAYTNRFLVLTKVIRELSSMEDSQHEDLIHRQVHSLRMRLQLIRAMQFLGVLSFAICTVSMLALFLGAQLVGLWLFGLALLLLVASLMVSLVEVHYSTQAINIEIEKLDRRKRSDTA